MIIHRIERREGEKTQIHSERKDGSRIFTAMYPFYGLANSKTLQMHIEADGLVVPTAREVAIFGNALYGGKEPEEKKFTRIMGNQWVRGFTGIYFDTKNK